MAKTPTGTREWSGSSVNCCTGCANGCLYCYGRELALRRGAIKQGWEWTRQRPRKPLKRYGRHRGVVMFPSVHDITPENLSACLEVLDKLLRAGNRVLVVSKPRLACIQRLCSVLAAYRAQMEFRFSIGAVSDELLGMWEPGAPSLGERLDCLAWAAGHGFATSVSCEPLLEPWGVEQLVAAVSPFVGQASRLFKSSFVGQPSRLSESLEGKPETGETPVLRKQTGKENGGSIWIGKLNQPARRLAWCFNAGMFNRDQLARLSAEMDKLKTWQTDDAVLKIYEQLKGNPRIRWKDSYAEVIGRSVKP